MIQQTVNGRRITKTDAAVADPTNSVICVETAAWWTDVVATTMFMAKKANPELRDVWQAAVNAAHGVSRRNKVRVEMTASQWHSVQIAEEVMMLLADELGGTPGHHHVYVAAQEKFAKQQTQQ